MERDLGVEKKDGKQVDGKHWLNKRLATTLCAQIRRCK